MSKRLFLAVALNEPLREAVAEWAGSARRRCAGWRWVAAQNLHLTLRFFGETDSGTQERLGQRLAGLGGLEGPFELELAGWGVFPSPSRPRVLWVGVSEGAQPLEHLAAEVEREAVDLGFAPEQRRFHPHLTVARAQRGRKAPQLPGDPQAPPERLGSMPVDRLVLYRSQLGSGGPTYTRELEVPLTGATPADEGRSRYGHEER